MELTHFNESGNAHMVDVSEKNETHRIAKASGVIAMKPSTIELIQSGTSKKGDVLSVAQVAGIMAAKKTSDLIPMCHPLLLSKIDLQYEVGTDYVKVESTVKVTGQTGVEMEALTAVSGCLLTIYDMVKAVDKDMVIRDIMLLEKSGGKSGTYRRK